MSVATMLESGYGVWNGRKMEQYNVLGNLSYMSVGHHVWKSVPIGII